MTQRRNQEECSAVSNGASGNTSTGPTAVSQVTRISLRSHDFEEPLSRRGITRQELKIIIEQALAIVEREMKDPWQLDE
jgi:hypothetical protein